MPTYEIREWVAVIEAERLSRRLELQYDLSGYTRSITRAGEASLERERKKMSERIKTLMHRGFEQQDADDSWKKIQGMGVFGVITGGKK